MCLPALPAGLTTALSIISTGAQLFQQQQAASAQKEYNDAVQRNATIAMNQRNAQVTQRQVQERDSAQAKLMENNLEAAKAKSTAKVAASAAGVSGTSVDALLADLSGAQGRYNSSVETNLRNSYAASDWDRQNIYNDFASTINGLKAPTMPDYVGAGLSIARTWNEYKKPPATSQIG